MAGDPAYSSTRKLVSALYLSAAITLGFAIVLGLVVDPLFFLFGLVALADLLIAWLFRSGRIGPLAARRQAAAAGDAASVAEADPSYNPYARED